MNIEGSKSNQEDPQFESVFSHLQSIVASLEDGKLNLSESMREFEKGIELAEVCKRLLHQAELKITEIKREYSEHFPDVEEEQF